ncbi:DUF805 domain-containing protein [Hasllibacter sp. MH4015]|uniref:DUF805 domain-containing protein n=1 Tax=Hasllibacter sp. MH4015 TaxID=2854029 RepID=UPI001CD4D187|nr:DUF805 domain-containing protein [Hasllibacter sp. MH4015]
MTFTESIRHNIVHCTNFSDRDPRSAYWWYVLFVSLGALVAMVLDFIIFWPAAGEGRIAAFLSENFQSITDFYINVMPITTFWYLLNYLPVLACGVRRMRDQNKPAWWFIVTIIFVTIMSVVVFNVTGPQSAELMMVAFNPNATMSELNRVLADAEQLNRTSTILSGIQTLPSLLIIIWMATRGTVGPNPHGEDPLG